MAEKYETISFSEEEYQEYYDYSHKNETNFTAMWDDIKEFIRVATKNGYQLLVKPVDGGIVIEYNYSDESFNGISLEWLGEDEYIEKISTETEE